MATLIELSDDTTTTSCCLMIVDYDVNFHMCRKGIWVGRRCQQRERIVLSYEHDPEVLYVGWSINGTTVLDPGYGTFTPPWGAPAPGTPDVTYQPEWTRSHTASLCAWNRAPRPVRCRSESLSESGRGIAAGSPRTGRGGLTEWGGGALAEGKARGGASLLGCPVETPAAIREGPARGTRRPGGAGARESPKPRGHGRAGGGAGRRRARPEGRC